MIVKKSRSIDCYSLDLANLFGVPTNFLHQDKKMSYFSKKVSKALKEMLASDGKIEAGVGMSALKKAETSSFEIKVKDRTLKKKDKQKNLQIFKKQLFTEFVFKDRSKETKDLKLNFKVNIELNNFSLTSFPYFLIKLTKLDRNFNTVSHPRKTNVLDTLAQKPDLKNLIDKSANKAEFTEVNEKKDIDDFSYISSLPSINSEPEDKKELRVRTKKPNNLVSVSK